MGAAGRQGSGGGMVLAIVVFLLSIAGAGAGFTVGTLIGGKPDQRLAGYTPSDETPAAGAETSARQSGEALSGEPDTSGSAEAEAEDERIDPLTLKVTRFPPVLTTLAEPKGKWIRIEGAILTANGGELPPELLAEQAGEQILAYLRTLRLDQIEGPSGYLGLKGDLTETVRVMSGGAVKGILIHGLVVE